MSAQGEVKSKSALFDPPEGTGKVQSLFELYRLGTLSAKGGPPRGGRVSRSPTCASKAEILTWWVPTKAPFFPELDVSVNSSFSLVLPAEPSPLSMEPGLPTGWNITWALLSGFPFNVTFPATGAYFEPQPIANRTAKPSTR